jgi:transcriptional regulator with GAF, ATPase, and Fis domain
VILVERAEFHRLLSEAAREMSSESTTQGTLERAVRMVTDLLPHCDAAGVSIVHGQSIETRAATSEALRQVDELQHVIQQGPCFDALRDSETVASGDLAADARWPEWGPKVADELGFRSTLAFLLFTDRGTRGALTLYSDQVDAFSDEDVDDGLALAAHVAVAYRAANTVDQFVTGLATRTVTGQATGIVMERFGLDPEAAFGVLVRISQRSNTKLTTLAAELVATGRMRDMDG